MEQLTDLYERALAAGRRREYPQAIELLKQILLATDELPEALLLLGRAYHAQGEYLRAAQVLQLYLNIHPDSAQGHFFAGRATLALGLLPPAIRHLKRSVELEPGFAPALGLLGLAVFRAGRPKPAIGLFEQALKLDPDNPRLFNGYLNALLTQAVRLYRHRRFTEARQLLQFIEGHRPDNLIVHLYLAGIHREEGETELALRHWELASRLAPEDPALYLQKAAVHLQRGDNRAALRELTEAFRRLGSRAPVVSDPEELARLAMMVLFQNRRYRDALEYARRLLRASYADAQAHAVMAGCLAELGEHRKARNHYLRASELEPDRLELRYGLAAVLWESGDHRALAEVVERIRRLAPDDPYAAYYQALIMPGLGADSLQTIPALQEQIRRHGPDPHLMCSLGLEYLKADLPELAGGWFRRTLQRVENHEVALRSLVTVERRLADEPGLLAACAEYLKHYPRSRDIRRQYAELLYRRREFARAAVELESLLPREPRSAGLRLLLARSYRQVRRNAEAVLLYRDLLRQDPSSEDLLRELALALAASGSQPTAVALVRKASQAFPKRPGIHRLLGSLYQRSRDWQRAAESLRQAVSLFPDDWQLARSLGMVYRRQGNTEFAARFLKRAEILRKRGQGPA
jgi:tetratricopeptide (TPR) repeat protein